MNFVLLFFLTLTVLACFFKFYSPREVKLYFLYYALSVTVLYTPAIYYTFDIGDSYRLFSDESLAIYQMLSIGIFIVIFISDRLAGVLCPPVSPQAIDTAVEPVISKTLKVLLFVLAAYLLFYISIYFNKFALIKLIKTGTLSRRSDITGDLPHWFSVYMFITTLIPASYFYITKNKSLFHKIIGFFIVLFFLGIDGNKGCIFVFTMYIAIFKFKKLLSLKNVFLVFMGMILYLFLMTGDFNFSNSENASHLGGAFRRTFVTQGAGIPNRIELKNNGYEWQHSRISKDVFEYIFGHDEGAYPTFFAIDIGIKWGWTCMYIVCMLVSLLLAVLSKKILQYRPNDDVLRWLCTYLIFIISVSDILHASNWIRFLYILTVMYLYVFFTRSNSPSKEQNQAPIQTTSI